MGTTPEHSFIEVFKTSQKIQNRIQENRSGGFETLIITGLDAFLEGDKPGLIHVLSFLYDEDSHLEMPKWERDVFNYRRLVIARFIQKEINSKFKMKELNRKWTNVVDPEVELWRKTLTMLERLHSLGYLTCHHPALAMLGLIKEKALLMFNFLTDDEMEGLRGREDAIDRWQHQNRQIQSRKVNTFSPDRYPHTWQILKAAKIAADDSDQFCTSYFMPVVRARMKVVTQLIRSDGKLRIKGKKIRQGSSINK